jgi:hypothetical protein
MTAGGTMTTQLEGMAADEALADSVGDAALAALLRTKPSDDPIPASVWWLIAETLRTSVTIRRTVATDLSPEREDLPILIAEARLLTEAALAELAQTTGGRPTPLALVIPDEDSSPQKAASVTTRPAFGLQLSVLFLARMLVSHQVTTPQRLANTLAAHLRALALVDASYVVTKPELGSA